MQIESLKAQIEADNREAGDVTHLIHKAHVRASNRLLQSSPSSSSAGSVSRKPIYHSGEAKANSTPTEMTLYARNPNADEEDTLAHEYGFLSPEDIMPLLEITMLQRRAVQYAGIVLTQPIMPQEDAESWKQWSGSQDIALAKPLRRQENGESEEKRRDNHELQRHVGVKNPDLSSAVADSEERKLDERLRKIRKEIEVLQLLAQHDELWRIMQPATIPRRAAEAL